MKAFFLFLTACFCPALAMACPDLSGTYVFDDQVRPKTRTVTQVGCSKLVIQDSWTYNGARVTGTSELLTDGVCRIYTSTEDTEACEAHSFKENLLETVVVNRRWPGVDHEFVALKMSYFLNPDGGLVHVAEFFGPTGENVGSSAETWLRKN